MDWSFANLFYLNCNDILNEFSESMSLCKDIVNVVYFIPLIELIFNYLLNCFICFKSFPSSDIWVKPKNKVLAYNTESEFAIQLDSRQILFRTNSNISIHNPHDEVRESSLDNFLSSLLFLIMKSFSVIMSKLKFLLVICSIEFVEWYHTWMKEQLLLWFIQLSYNLNIDRKRTAQTFFDYSEVEFFFFKSGWNDTQESQKIAKMFTLHFQCCTLATMWFIYC